MARLGSRIPALGVAKLSGLEIDTAKDWGGYDISNLGSRGLTIGDDILKGESAGLREEHGEVHGDEVASGDTYTDSVSFLDPFNNIPVVPWGLHTDNAENWRQNKSGTDEEHPVDTSGITITVYNASGVTSDCWFNWLAIGS